MLQHPLRVAHRVERLGSGQRVLKLGERAGLQVDLDVRPGVAVKETLAVIGWRGPGVDHAPPAAHNAARRIIAPHVEDHVLRAVGRPLHPQHPPVSLVHAVAADAEVPDRLAEMAGEVLLPRLAVADLGALGEAVAVSIDPRLPVGVEEARARVQVRIRAVQAPAARTCGWDTYCPAERSRVAAGTASAGWSRRTVIGIWSRWMPRRYVRTDARSGPNGPAWSWRWGVDVEHVAMRGAGLGRQIACNLPGPAPSSSEPIANRRGPGGRKPC